MCIFQVSSIGILVLADFATKCADNFFHLHVQIFVVSNCMILATYELEAFQALPISSFVAYNSFFLIGWFIIIDTCNEAFILLRVHLNFEHLIFNFKTNSYEGSIRFLRRLWVRPCAYFKWLAKESLLFFTLPQNLHVTFWGSICRFL